MQTTVQDSHIFILPSYKTENKREFFPHSPPLNHLSIYSCRLIFWDNRLNVWVLNNTSMHHSHFLSCKRFLSFTCSLRHLTVTCVRNSRRQLSHVETCSCSHQTVRCSLTATVTFTSVIFSSSAIFSQFTLTDLHQTFIKVIKRCVLFKYQAYFPSVSL